MAETSTKQRNINSLSTYHLGFILVTGAILGIKFKRIIEAYQIDLFANRGFSLPVILAVIGLSIFLFVLASGLALFCERLSDKPWIMTPFFILAIALSVGSVANILMFLFALIGW